MKRSTVLLAIAALLGALFAPRTEAATGPTITQQAHLQVYPRAPSVRSTWELRGGTTRTDVKVQSWIYVVDRTTNQITGVLGMRTTTIPGFCCTGSYTIAPSWATAVSPPECLVPAGHILNARDGRVYASTVGPRYCW